MSLDLSSIKTPLAGWERVIELLALMCVVAGLGEVALNYAALPGKVPTHFNAAGQPNGWGPKWMIWLVPTLGVVLFLSLAGASRLSLRWYNMPFKITRENAMQQYELARRLIIVMNLLCCGLMAAISWTGVVTAQGATPPLPAGVFWGAFLLFAVIIAVYFLLAARAR